MLKNVLLYSIVPLSLLMYILVFSTYAILTLECVEECVVL